MTELAPNSEETWVGRWWLPDAPGRTVPGTLHFDPECGLRIELHEGLKHAFIEHEGHSATVSGVSKQIPCIFGLTEKNEQVSLFSCTDVGGVVLSFADLENSEPHRQDLIAEKALIGVHQEDPKEPAFTEAEAHIDDLGAWIGDRRLKIEQTVIEKARQAQPWTAQVKAHTSEHSIALKCGNRHLTRRLRQRYVEENSASWWFTITKTEPSSAAVLEDLLESLGELISISAYRAEGVGHRYLCTEDAHKVRTVALKTRRAEPEDQETPVSEFLLVSSDVDLDDLLDRWFRLRSRHTATINIIVGGWHLPRPYLEMQTLAVISSAEAMEAKNIEDGKYVEEKKCKGGVKLTQKLKSLAGRLDPELQTFLGVNIEAWANATCQARNDISHRGEFESGKEEKSFHLIQAIEGFTRVVVVLNLIRELGGPTTRVLGSIQRNRRVQRDLDAARVEWPAKPVPDHA